jgi:hypothetical protein
MIDAVLGAPFTSDSATLHRAFVRCLLRLFSGTQVPFDILDLKTCAIISPQTAARQVRRLPAVACAVTVQYTACSALDALHTS